MLINRIVNPVISLARLAENINSTDDKDAIELTINELDKLRGTGKIAKLISLFKNLRHSITMKKNSNKIIEI